MTEPDVPHYRRGVFANTWGVQPITFTRYMTLPAGTAFKYVARYLDKGTPHEDLTKALDYLQWAREDFVAFDVWPVLDGFESHLTLELQRISKYDDESFMYQVLESIVHGDLQVSLVLVDEERDRLDGVR